MFDYDYGPKFFTVNVMFTGIVKLYIFENCEKKYSYLVNTQPNRSTQNFKIKTKTNQLIVFEIS